MSAAARFLLLRPRGVSPLSYLRSLSGKIVLWPTQETTGTVAGAENDAKTTPDTKQLATLTYAAYTPGAGWSNSGGQVALHTAGNVATLAQAGLLAVGKTYVLTTIISGRTAGTVTPTGGTAISASTTAQAITATGTALVYTPTTDFDGSIDLALVVLKQTGILAWSAYPGAELLSNGDMEAGTTDWLANNATLAEETTIVHSGAKSLKLTRGGALAAAYQTLTGVLGQTISVDSWGYNPTAGGSAIVAARIGTVPGNNDIGGTDSSTKDAWVNLVTKAIATADTVYISFGLSGAGVEYVYYDDCSAKVTNPLDADTSGATIGQPMGTFGFGYSYDAVNDFLNWYATEVNSMWNPGADFSIQIAFTSTSWAAGTATLFMAKVDANNFISITRNAADLIFNYTAGGTAKTVTIATGSPTGNNTAWLTVDISGDALNGYFNGVAGTPATTLGTFVGNFAATTCTVGASSTAGGDPWGGLGSQPYICDVVRTQTEITTHSNIAGV